MSKRSKVIETAIRHTDYKEINSDKNKAIEDMKHHAAEEEKPFELPKRKYQTKVKVKEMFDCQMIIFNESTSTENLVIYLHGGAYVNEIVYPHIVFCDNLAKKANATVFAPLYPLAPNHTYEETYEIVENLFDLLLKFEKPITVMGDSAGGGLSASFSEYLAENGLPQPQHLILISPWVDVSMSGDYDDYIEDDPMLGVEGARELGKAWAGNLDTQDYRISPLFGNIDSLPQTTIFVGTHEIIYPDIIKFYNKLKEKDIDVELNIGEGMYHIYPVLPLAPESKEAFNRIVEIISK